MKNTLLTLLIAVSLAALVSGCASVSVATEGKDMVVVENSGCFLFYCIPLFSGDPDYPNQEVCNWFENTVKVKTNIRLLDEEAARQGAAGVRNLASHQDEEVIFPLIFKRKIYRTSAELIKY